MEKQIEVKAMEEKFQKAVEELREFAATHNGKMFGNTAWFSVNGTAVKEVGIDIYCDFVNMTYIYKAKYSSYNLPNEEVEKVFGMKFQTVSEAYTIVGRANAINKFFEEL